MIYVLIGIPGAGKTTLAQTMVRYMNAVIVGRDPLREKLFGYRPDNLQVYYEIDSFKENEKIVGAIQDAMIKQALSIGKDVIIDNTNLELKFIRDLMKYNVPIKFVLVEVDLAEAIHRDSLRPSPVGEYHIKRYFEKLEHLKKVFDFKDWTPDPVQPILNNKRLPGAFVFDIDGTLALKTGDRSPYDWKRVGEDEVNLPVLLALNAIKEHGYRIIICSGRDSVCRPETEEWLDRNAVDYDWLLMRGEKNMRSDTIVKEEMWRYISEHFNIIAMFDDRQKVVDHGRKLGLTVFQVAPGNF